MSLISRNMENPIQKVQQHDLSLLKIRRVTSDLPCEIGANKSEQGKNRWVKTAALCWYKMYKVNQIEGGSILVHSTGLRNEHLKNIFLPHFQNRFDIYYFMNSKY